MGGRPPKGSLDPALRVDDVSKAFGGLRAVTEVSLIARGGVVTAVIGPNGAGKTTLFNIINGFQPPDSGSIYVDGRVVKKPTPLKMADVGMARTFQTPAGFPSLSVWENLVVSGASRQSESLWSAVLGPRAWREDLQRCHERAIEVMTDLGLLDLRDVRVGELTPGPTKLVEVARQLMTGPRILLLDEPAAGVDPASLERLAALVARVADAGVAVLLIDHNLEFVLKNAGYVYVMANGTVIADGEGTSVMEDSNVVMTYLGAGV